MRKLVKASMLAAGSFAAFASVAAAAQSQPSGVPEKRSTDAGPPDPGVAGATGQNEDIIVTAQRRSQRLQDIPIAITAITSDQLAASHTTSTQDLQFSVPGLVYSNNSGFAQPFLRGIGSDIVQPNADPSVATYIDGVYISSNLATITGLLGIERVEVLKGPQGTLYGRNAVGGAISIVTLTPGDHLEGKASVGVGNYGELEGSGFVSGPLGGGFSAGIYAGGTRRDSFTTRVGGALPEEPDAEGQWGLRAKLVYEHGPLKLAASADYNRSVSFEGAAFRQVQPNATAYSPLFGGVPLDQPYVVARNTADYVRTRQWGGSLRADLDLGGAQLVSISGYRNVKSFAQLDFDGTTRPVLAFGGQPQVSRQYSQEIQLLSPTGSRINWILGGYGFQETSGFVPTRITAPVLFPLGGLTPVLDVLGLVRARSFAMFGQATAPIGEKIRVTLGARYTIDQKHYFGGATILRDLNLTQLVPTILAPENTKTWREFTPRVSVDYRMGETLLYASYSRGFKAGAYNISAPGSAPVDPEKLSAVEIGSKSDLLNRRLRVNLSGYYYRIKGLQVQIVDAASGAGAQLQNAASAEIYGMEAEVAATLSPGLKISASVAYSESRYISFPNYSGFGPAPFGNNTVAQDVSGNDVTRNPRWVGSLDGRYRHYLSNGGHMDLDASYYYNAGFFWEATEQLRERPYNIVNASLDYTLPNEAWTVSLWGRNLTNEYYHTQALLNAYGTVVLDAAPRTYGVTITRRFGSQNSRGGRDN